MKTILIAGSPRRKSNTGKMLEAVARRLRDHDIETELIPLHDMKLEMCRGCLSCKKTGECVAGDVDELMGKIERADALVIASPVYFGSVTAQVKTLMDKIGLLAEAHGNSLAGKIGGAVSVARRCGHLQVIHQIVSFFGRVRMATAGGGWAAATSGNENDVSSDSEGFTQARQLADDIAALLSNNGNPRK